MELTVETILKYFPSGCFGYLLGNLQNLPLPLSVTYLDTIAAGALWVVDYAKMSGDDAYPVKSYLDGFTHWFVAVDFDTRRVVSWGTNGTKYAVRDLIRLNNFVILIGKIV